MEELDMDTEDVFLLFILCCTWFFEFGSFLAASRLGLTFPIVAISSSARGVPNTAEPGAPADPDLSSAYMTNCHSE